MALTLSSLSLPVEEFFASVEQTGEPSTLFISPEIGDLEVIINEVKRRGLRMAAVPAGCISVLPPLPMADAELFDFCKNYCLGTATSRADSRRDLYFRRFKEELGHAEPQPNNASYGTFHPFDAVIRVAELCLLVCNAPSCVVDHLYASSPYLQISPVREICSTIAAALSQTEKDQENGMKLSADGIQSLKALETSSNSAQSSADGAGAEHKASPFQQHGHQAAPSDSALRCGDSSHSSKWEDLTGLEQVDEPSAIAYFCEKDFKAVNESGVFFQTFHRVAAVFIKNGVDAGLCGGAAQSLRDAATHNNLRARTNGGEPPETGIVGYYDYLSNPTQHKCRETQFMRKHASAIEKGCGPFMKALNMLYATHAPHHFKIQEQVIPVHYRLFETVFSTITVNRNFRTAPHTDSGDFKSGLAALCVLKGDASEGCHLAIPALGKAFQLSAGDVLFFDASLIHGNTEIHGSPSSWERISVVCYLRNGLMSATCEAETRRQLGIQMSSKFLNSNLRGSSVINLNDMDSSLPPIYIPGGIVAKLSTAQTSALCFIADRIVKDTGCIISMAMGLGKTLVALTTCFSALVARPDLDIIVVAPKPLIPNWVQEISKWAPNGLEFPSCIFCDGIVTSGYENRVADFTERRRRGMHGEDGTLFVINPESVSSFFKRCGDFIRTGLVIVDEGHCLGSKGNKLMDHLNKFNCPRRVVLSGTPLQNVATELYRLVQWVYAGVTEVLPKKTFNVFEAVITAYTNGDDTALREARKAQKYINEWMKPFVFREIDVDLPPLVDYLLVCGNSDSQKMLTLREISAAASPLVRANEHRPAHITAHPLSFYDLIAAPAAGAKHSRQEEEEEEEGREELAEASDVDSSPPEERVASPCGSTSGPSETGEAYPASSLSSLRSPQEAQGSSASSPPLPATREYFDRLLHSNSINEFASHSGKVSALLLIMKHISSKNEKVIIFSQYIGPQEMIARTLRAAGYTTFAMRGRDSHGQRRSTASSFTAHIGSAAMVLSTKIAAFGHDFTAANHVVLFDLWWNPQADAQAIARAYRRNQVHPVVVYRLASELEDSHVIKIQIRKLALFKSIIHDCVSRTCRPEELIDCADEEEDAERRTLWSSLKEAGRLSGGGAAVQAVYRYTDTVRPSGEEQVSS